MKLKLTLQRPSGPDADILVTTDASATVGEVALAIATVDPSRPAGMVAPQSAATLRVVGEGIVEPDVALGDSVIRPGAVVAVVPAGTVSPAPPRGVATIRLDVIEGPDAGTTFDLPIGTHYLGRNALQTKVTLTDPAVSSRHARLDVLAGAVRLVDLNSAHGIEVDGGLVTRVELSDGGTVLVGDSMLRVTTLLPPEKAAELASGTIRFNRPPRVETPFAGLELPAPAEPDREAPHAVEMFEAALVEFEVALAAAQTDELQHRREEAPSSAVVLSETLDLGTLLWSRRPDRDRFLSLRLGSGRARSRNRIVTATGEKISLASDERIRRLAENYSMIDDVPIVEDLTRSGAIGVAGKSQGVAGVARGLLSQIAGLHSPAELTIAAIVSESWTPEFEYLKWLPHVDSAHSPIDGAQLANSAATAEALLAAIERLIDDRAEHARRVPAVLLLVSSDAPADYARLVRVAERGPDAAVYTLWIGPAVTDLPAVARTFIDLSDDDTAEVGFVQKGLTVAGVRTEGVSREQALVVARHLTQIVDASAEAIDSSDLPSSVRLLTLIGPEAAESADFIVNRWRLNESINARDGETRTMRAGRLRAIVGRSGADPMQLDLRAQGPHALVVGTTGSGKSEFLKTWVLSMAAEYSPDRVNFLFIDYLGGAAFGDCLDLPHSVGLVTDHDSLERRVLPALTAELRHRGQLLLRKKVKDLRSLERTGDPETPPALVVVVDEFAEIAAEIPAFTDGLLDILRQGRAVGVHLVLATQRSLGGASTQLQTQTNLRIALRVADADDSTAAVGDASAATFDPGLPGRAVARTNAGRPILFQTAYSGGLSFADTSASPVSITELRFGAELLWEHSVQERTIPERLITDQGRIVATIKAASREASIGAPRKPLPPELSASYDLAVVPQRRVDTELVLGVSDDIVNGKQDPVLFLPDQHGNIGIFGAGGSGKTTALRTLVAAAGITPKGGPVDVYAIDFAGGGLRMLEALPNVGAVVSGDDQERIIRLLRMLRDEAESRSVRFSTMLADTITSYRRIAGEPDERRLLLLIDGFPSFRESFETSSALSKWFSVFHDLMSLGRPLGIHVALTADRPLALGRQTAAALSRRVLLRMTDEIDYDGAREGRIVMGMNTPPGRGIVDKLETQIAVLGGDGNVSAQAKAIRELGEAMERAGRVTAPSIGVLSHEISPQEMPANVQGAPVLGVSDDDLQPIGFRTTGVFLVGGPSGSGRSTALRWLAESVRRAHPDAKAYYLGNQSSELPATGNWAAIARTPETVIELARELASSIAVAPEQPKTLIIVEDIASFLNTPPDGALVELMKSVKRSRHLLVAESEISGWGSSWPLLSEAKGFRHGFLLQPDASDTDLILRTTAPRVTRSEFPPGRGLYVSRGKVVRVQLPHA